MVKEAFFFTQMGYTAYPQDKAKEAGYSNLLFSNEHFDSKRANETLRDVLRRVPARVGDPRFRWHPTQRTPQQPLEHDAFGQCDRFGNGKVDQEGENRVSGQHLADSRESGAAGRRIGHDRPDIRRTPSSAASSGASVWKSLANNVSPLHNRERYDEAHDLIVKAWTTPGPFRWEGKHFNLRVVNPWMLPLQKPHPPIWIPGTTSPETVIWAAEHGYPYIALAPPLELAEDVFDLYHRTAREAGYEPTSEHRGYVVRVNVADTDEESYEQGRHFYWQLGSSFGIAVPHHMSPPGYSTRAAAQTARARRMATERRGAVPPGGSDVAYEEAHATTQIITGNPDTVIEKLKKICDIVDPAWLVLWGREGNMSHKAAMRSIDLLGQEVIPAIKEYVPERAR